MNPLCDRNPKEAKNRIKVNRKISRFLTFAEGLTAEEFTKFVIGSLFLTGKKERLVSVLSEIAYKSELGKKYDKSCDRMSLLYKRVSDKFLGDEGCRKGD